MITVFLREVFFIFLRYLYTKYKTDKALRSRTKRYRSIGPQHEGFELLKSYDNFLISFEHTKYDYSNEI